MDSTARSEIGRLLGSLRHRKVLACAVCGQPSPRPLRNGAKYCSNACRQKAYHARKREQDPPTPTAEGTPEVPR